MVHLSELQNLLILLLQITTVLDSASSQWLEFQFQFIREVNSHCKNCCGELDLCLILSQKIPEVEE